MGDTVKKLAILGSTGSIGLQTLDIVRNFPESFQVVGLACSNSVDSFKAQLREFSPAFAYIGGGAELQGNVKILSMENMASHPDVDIVVVATTGKAGLAPALAAIKAGKILAIANKEILVMAGELITGMASKSGARILPIDSEHSAIWQCLQGEGADISRLLLTASGGPFFGFSKRKLSKVTAREALNHPTWKMGKKVTIDSATLFNKGLEAIETRWLFNIAYENGSLMSDDWKWVLRTASSTRPVLRFAAGPLARDPATSVRSAVFSDTRGILKVSAGDGPLVTGIGNEADLGTAFALATSLYGNNMLQVSGNVGYGSQTGVPTAAFRTSYSRHLGGGNPEVSVTMRQLFLPGRLGAALAGTESALPILRSVSAGFNDRTEIADGLALQYGFTLDSVAFLDHLNYFSPYARLSYQAGESGEVDFAYTSGNGRPDLAGAVSQDVDLQRDLNSLGLFPRISLRGARPKIQRGEEYELTYSRKAGSRIYQVSAYRESVTNAALSLVAPAGMYSGGDILPDLFSGNSIFDAGDYRSVGYTAAVTQNMGDHLSATVMYGSMGALTAQNREIVSNSPDELRSMIRAGRKQAATTRITATSPWTGTHLIASYQWTGSHRWAMPGHLYSTQAVGPMPGLNVYFRQPIPGLSILPWRMEATADLRNLLAQGYLPLGMVDGQRVMLVETPRSFRGGLSFIF